MESPSTPPMSQDLALSQMLSLFSELNACIEEYHNKEGLLSHVVAVLEKQFKNSAIFLLDDHNHIHESYGDLSLDELEVLDSLIKKKEERCCLIRSITVNETQVSVGRYADCPSCPIARKSKELTTLINPLVFRGETFGILMLSIETIAFTPVVHEQSKIIAHMINHALTVMRHQDEQLRLLEESKRNLSLLSGIYENSPDLLTVIDEDTVIHDINKSAFDISREKIIGTTLFERLDPSRIETIKRAIQHAKATGQTSFYQLNESLFNGSQTIWFNRVSLLKNQGSRELFLICSTNVTEQEELQASLEASKEEAAFLSDIINKANISVAIGYPDGSMGLSNPAYQQMLGYTGEELQRLDWNQVLTPLKWESVEAENLKRLHETKEPIEYEKEYISKEGKIIPVHMSVHPKIGADGEVEAYCAFIIDITRRKQFEQRLRREKERTENYLDITKSIIIAIDREGKISLINTKGAQLLGYKKEDLQGRSWFDTCIPEGDRTKVNEVFHDILEDPEKYQYFENEVVTNSGELKLIAWNNSAIKDSSGSITGLLCSGDDITELRKTQRVLEHTKNQFEEAMNATHDGLWDWDLLTDEVYFSPEWKAMLGYEMDELRQHLSVWEELTDPQDAVRAWEMQKKVISGELDRFKINLRMKHKDGHWVDILSRAKAIFDGTGKAIRLIGTHMDISQQVKTEKELLLSEQRYRSLVETATDAIFLLDHKGIFIEANSSAYTRLGYAFEEFIGMSIKEIDPNYSIESFREFWADVPENEVRTFETGHKKKDGDLLPVEVSGKRFLIKNETFYYGIARDISARKESERKHQVLQDQLIQMQKLDSIGRLAGGVAHDFNNMLSVIIGNTELSLQLAESSSPFYQNLKEIQSAAERSATLTKQLLTFARKGMTTKEVLDLNVTIENLLSMLRRLVGEQIEISWLPSKAPQSIYIDSSQVDQILTNLVVNASHAIKETGTITITTETIAVDSILGLQAGGIDTGDFVVLTISDSGKGMSTEEQAHIFEPFYTSKPRGEGSGLGLSTVYGIVKQNNGFIHVYSEIDRGTTFKIYLPATKQSIPEPVKEIIPSTRIESEISILLVEDEQTILKLEYHILKEMGLQVMAVDSPTQALKAIEENSFNLLITDVIMPEMNGKDLSLKIKGVLPQIKVLYLSGYTSDVIINQGILIDGTAFLQKPFTINSFTKKVKQILGR